jgi:hypothetical protein
MGLARNSHQGIGIGLPGVSSVELRQPSPTPTEGSPMTTDGNSSDLDFPRLGPRQVRADFNGGDIASEGGA